MVALRAVTTSDLKAAELFAACQPETLERLCSQSRVRALKRHQILFAEGDPVDSLAVVRTGRLKVFATSSSGDELLLSIVEAGETLGEVGLLDGTERSASVEAMEPSEVVLVPRDELLRMLQEDHNFSQRVHTRISALARRLTNSSTDLAFVDLPRRLAKALLAREASGAGRAGLSLSQSDLASLVGGSRQAVNGALAGFERRGWVRREAGRVIWIDTAALAKFAAG